MSTGERPGGGDAGSALCRSRARVTELSFGAADTGNLFTPATDSDAADAVDAVWEAGTRSFDTAPHYGLDLSKRRLGATLRPAARQLHRLDEGRSPARVFPTAARLRAVGLLAEHVPIPEGPCRP